MLKAIETGFECSDMSSFFSSNTGGFRNTVTPLSTASWHIKLAHGAFNLTKITSGNSFGYEAVTTQDTWLYDFVVRYVFPGIHHSAKINSTRVPPETNKYWQFPVKECTLGNVRIKIVESILPTRFRQELYMRPTGNSWIVHARAMAHNPQLLALKHVDGFSKVFFGSQEVRDKLWRVRELVDPTAPEQIQPHCWVPGNTRFRVITEVSDV